MSVAGEVDQDRIDAIERAIELDQPSQSARRARLLALEAQELTYAPEVERRRLTDQAVALARDAGDPRTLAEVLRNAYQAYWSADTLKLRSPFVPELLASATAAHDPALLFWAHIYDFHAHVELGDLELGQPTLSWIATVNAASWAQLRGELQTAEELAEQAFQIGQEAGEPDAALNYGGCLQNVRLLQGRGHELVAMVEQSVAAYPAIVAWRRPGSIPVRLDKPAEAAAIVRDAATDREQYEKRCTGAAPGLGASRSGET